MGEREGENETTFQSFERDAIITVVHIKESSLVGLRYLPKYRYLYNRICTATHTFLLLQKDS